MRSRGGGAEPLVLPESIGAAESAIASEAPLSPYRSGEGGCEFSFSGELLDAAGSEGCSTTCGGGGGGGGCSIFCGGGARYPSPPTIRSSTFTIGDGCGCS